ncbi:Hpt domain-containing protein, partial [Oceanicella sp. SM1341]|uniref:Hpt domain-containing protein n=1 Tax=Oceanicella sp. SM1341 TaxID=1548889 RepID=UPI0018E52953
PVGPAEPAAGEGAAPAPGAEAGPAGPAARDPVDIATMRGAQKVMGKRFNRMLEIFIADGRATIARLPALLAERNMEECSRLAHSMKSSARLLGAPAVAEAAADLEWVTKNSTSDPSEAPERAAKLGVAFRAFLLRMRELSRKSAA